MEALPTIAEVNKVADATLNNLNAQVNKNKQQFTDFIS